MIYFVEIVKLGWTCHGMVWYGLVWFGQHSEAACSFRKVICGFRKVIFGFLDSKVEVIWVAGFRIRWVGRTDAWVGQVGGYVRWLGSSGGSGK